VRRAVPISPETLRLLAGTCDPATMAGLRDRSLLLVAYAIGRRASTLAGLRIQDIQAAGEDGMTVYIRYSKTDQAGRGEEVNVPFGKHAETCAVRATWAWLAALKGRGVTSGPLYQRVDAWDRLGCEPGAAGFGPRGHLQRDAVSRIVRRRHRLAGLPEPGFISGHSLRSGAVTTALAAGAPSLAVAEQYGFAPLSPVMQVYSRAVSRVRNNPAKLSGL
jgi:site-specific recombinase XerD